MNQVNETVFVNQEIETPDTETENENLMQLYRELGQAYYEGAYEDPLPQLLPLFDQITEFRKAGEKQADKEFFRESQLMDSSTPVQKEIPAASLAENRQEEMPTECEPQAEAFRERASQGGAFEETELVQDSLLREAAETAPVPNESTPAFDPAEDFEGKDSDSRQPESENPVTDKIAESPDEDQTEIAAEEIPAVQNICKFCGAELPEGAVFCGFCGKQTTQSPVPEPEPVPAERPRFCQNCGSPIGRETRFCGSCGTPVEIGGEC